MFTMLLISSLLGADVQVMLKTPVVTVDVAAQKTALGNAIKEMFPTASLSNVVFMSCTRVKDTNSDKLVEKCSLRESGTMTKTAYATARKAGQKIQATKIDGTTVTYQKVTEDVLISANAKTKLLAYFQITHLGVEPEWLNTLQVGKDNGGAIKSMAVYTTVIDDADLAGYDLDSKVVEIVN